MQVVTNMSLDLLTGQAVLLRVSVHFASNATHQTGPVPCLIDEGPVVAVVRVIIGAVVSAAVAVVVAVVAIGVDIVSS